MSASQRLMAGDQLSDGLSGENNASPEFSVNAREPVAEALYHRNAPSSECFSVVVRPVSPKNLKRRFNKLPPLDNTLPAQLVANPRIMSPDEFRRVVNAVNKSIGHLSASPLQLFKEIRKKTWVVHYGMCMAFGMWPLFWTITNSVDYRDDQDALRGVLERMIIGFLFGILLTSVVVHLPYLCFLLCENLTDIATLEGVGEAIRVRNENNENSRRYSLQVVMDKAFGNPSCPYVVVIRFLDWRENRAAVHDGLIQRIDGSIRRPDATEFRIAAPTAEETSPTQDQRASSSLVESSSSAAAPQESSSVSRTRAGSQVYRFQWIWNASFSGDVWPGRGKYAFVRDGVNRGEEIIPKFIHDIGVDRVMKTLKDINRRNEIFHFVSPYLGVIQLMVTLVMVAIFCLVLAAFTPSVFSLSGNSLKTFLLFLILVVAARIVTGKFTDGCVLQFLNNRAEESLYGVNKQTEEEYRELGYRWHFTWRKLRDPISMPENHLLLAYMCGSGLASLPSLMRSNEEREVDDQIPINWEPALYLAKIPLSTSAPAAADRRSENQRQTHDSPAASSHPAHESVPTNDQV